jgi:guanylate kinase
VTVFEAPAAPVVLSAPSGAGKTTIARALVDQEEDFVFSVSVTTRPRRRTETNGVDYLFGDEREFLRLVDQGELAEWARVHGNYYGTPLQNLREAGLQGRHAVLDIDVQGARQIRQAVPEALLLFILPPSMEVLLGRLISRGTEEDRVIGTRLRTALRELESAEEFDAFVVNRDLRQSVERVKAIVAANQRSSEGRSQALELVRTLRADLESFLRESHRFQDTSET